MPLRPVKVFRLAITAAGVVLLCGLLALLGGTRLVTAAGTTALVIRGGSMEPGIPLGALAFAEPADTGSLVPGDVIAYRLGSGSIVTHRITRAYPGGPVARFETRGDANPAPDPVLVEASAVVGRVRFYLPFAGYLFALLSIPSGIAAVGSFMGLLFLIGWLIKALEEPVPRPLPAT